jgi:hypothetical protein
MADIVIHHCRLHVVRQGGWSWGAEPKGVARLAVEALRRLLERQLAGLWSEDADIAIVAPVRVVVPVRLGDLRAAADDQFGDPQAIALGDQFRAAVAHAVAQAVRASVPSNSETPARADTLLPRRTDADTDPRAKLIALLVDWLRRGELEGVLHAVGESTLDAWERTLLATVDVRPRRSVGPGIESASPRQPVPQSHIAVADQPIRPDARSQPVARIDTLRARILAMVAALAAQATGVAALDAEWVEALNRALPLSPSAATDAQAQAAKLNRVYHRGTISAAETEATRRTADVSRTAALGVSIRRKAGRSAPGDGLAHCALPFLMLGTLAKIGYLDALAAMLSAARLSDQAASFATALAFKVVEPPERGWRRSPAALETVALFAGLSEAVANEQVAAFARQAADFLPALDRVLADALALGHDANAPLLLAAAPADGWLLAEVNGLFPIAWSESAEELFPVVSRFGRPTVLVPAACAGGGLLAQLDAMGMRFVTDAAPTRHESWRCLRPAARERWWTNDDAGPEGPLVQAGRKLEMSAEALAACWSQLAVLRRAVTPGDGGPLEMSLALAAAVALADLSWTLWQDAGATDGLLALQRFGDLDARVRIADDDILVKIPLGKRAFDLAAHGCLADVRGVPWFGGRVLRFSGGLPG